MRCSRRRSRRRCSRFPLFRLKGDYFAFGTLALLPLAEVLALNLVPVTNGSDGIVLPPENVLARAYFIALAACVLTAAVTAWLTHARFGYALKSIRNDEEVAEVMGIRIFPLKLAVIVLAAAFAGLAGGIQAWQMSFIDPGTVFGLNVALVPIAMALLGGSGLLWGPLVGVLLLATMQQWLLVNVKGYQATIYGTVILLIGRFMPGGLLRAGWVRKRGWLRGLTQEHHERITGLQTARAAGTAQDELPLEIRVPDRARVLLECRDLTMAFGGNVAVNRVNLKITQGESSASSGPTARARPRCSTASPRSTSLAKGGWCSTESRSRAETRPGGASRRGAHLPDSATLRRPHGAGEHRGAAHVRRRRLKPREALQQARDFVAYAVSRRG